MSIPTRTEGDVSDVVAKPASTAAAPAAAPTKVVPIKASAKKPAAAPAKAAPAKKPAPAAKPKPDLEVKAKAAPSAASVIDAGGLISQNTALKMQQDAAGIPPAATTIQKGISMESTTPTAPVAVEPELSKFNRLFVNLMITLTLGDDRLYGTKDALQSVQTPDGDTANLYSPFRKAPKKKDQGEAAGSEGVIRHSLEALLDITDTVNSSKIVYLGKSSDANANLVGAIETTRKSIEGLFPFAPDDEVLALEIENSTAVVEDEGEDDEDEDEGDGGSAAMDPVERDPDVEVIKFSDLVSVRSWINSPAANADAEVAHNAVIDFVINAGALYDSPERGKFIRQVESVLNLILASRVDSGTNVLLAINLRSSQIADSAVRELLGSLLDDEGYMLYTRPELPTRDSDWLPQDVSDVTGKLLYKDCDLLLVKLVGVAADEEETA